MIEYDPLEHLPELPSDVDEATAGLWAATVLMRAALEREWRKHIVREVLMTLTVGVCMDDRNDAELHDDLQACVTRMRAVRAELRAQ